MKEIFEEVKKKTKNTLYKNENKSQIRTKKTKHPCMRKIDFCG